MTPQTPEAVLVSTLDLLDAACLCHAALAQDSPEPPKFYINQILNLMMGPLPISMRSDIDVYLAEKKYLPPLKLVKPNEAEANNAANIILND